MAASWVVPPPKEILKKEMAAAGGCVRLPLAGGSFISPRAQRNLKKGMAVAGGVSSLARPRKWAGKRGSLHIVGKCGQTAFFHPVRPLSPFRRFRAAPLSAAARRAPCGCRAVSWSLRRCPRLSPSATFAARRPMVTPPLSAAARRALCGCSAAFAAPLSRRAWRR